MFTKIRAWLFIAKILGIFMAQFGITCSEARSALEALENSSNHKKLLLNRGLKEIQQG